MKLVHPEPQLPDNFPLFESEEEEADYWYDRAMSREEEEE